MKSNPHFSAPLLILPKLLPRHNLLGRTKRFILFRKEMIISRAELSHPYDCSVYLLNAGDLVFIDSAAIYLRNARDELFTVTKLKEQGVALGLEIVATSVVGREFREISRRIIITICDYMWQPWLNNS